MCDLRACFGRGNCRAACVGEEIEHFDLSAGRNRFTDDPGKPVPVDGLLGKQTCMFEVERLEPEREVPVVDRPLFGKIDKLPLAAALFAAVVVRVGLFPLLAAGRFPYDLRVRTDELIAAPELEFFTVGRIQYLIIFPGICNPHIFLHF